jgi:glyoxylase-like metal-dependent hydrolase (beta-lactamase superfamily II)
MGDRTNTNSHRILTPNEHHLFSGYDRRMIHEVLAVGPLQCNCSILGDETSREAVVVDPGDEIPRILQILERHQLTVKQIIVTHAHIDHIAGAHRLKQLTGAPVLYNQRDLPLVAMMEEQAGWIGVRTPEVSAPDDSLEDGDPVGVSGLSGTVIHTPGHTEGSLCLYLPEQGVLLAGDTLFAGSIGRTDLPGGSTGKILASIRDRLLPLPDGTKVIAGHGKSTTIGVERRSNPFLQDI